MDYVHIENLKVHGKHGVKSQERIDGHTFLVSVRMGVDTTKAGESDDIRDAVDYSPVRKLIEEVVTTHSYHLLETLARVIIERIFEDARIRSVEFTIKKPEVWPNAIPGITVVRER